MSRSYLLIICLKTLNVYYIILWMVFVFCTMIANGLLMTTNVSDCQYGHGVKGQCQIYFKCYFSNLS